MIQYLPHVNVTLNFIAAVLLVIGLLLIKRGRETAHKRVMISALGVSVLFSISYLTYHAQAPSKRLPSDTSALVKYPYYAMLVSHILLAATVPVLAVITIVLGLRDRRAAHRRLARWTFPIWMYVSVTGVLVYVVIYQVFP